ncbi:zinc finger BED domain-containing protein RICESLEEPER 2-like [Papaver somniferum]|uniref:zinc finger BED domain-containing protein RICESLEEPER 2-like n=1 Tax=Papaver somniferum TaxID=3469 RepID=UPI000E6FCF0C|nr:zinc finger BED domain-containing protein RICESLEEPER 2-like [Papaver somniferum]
MWAVCRICGERKKSGGNAGTSHLKRHTNSCLKKRKTDNSQTTIVVNGQGKIATFNFNQARARKNVIKLIILRELPFQFVEDPIFQWFINASFHPGFVKFSRNTLRTDIYKCYLEGKQQLKRILLDSPGRISLTSDIWLSKQRLSYLGITAHFIDKNWVLQKRIITYALIDTSHTGENIAEFIFRKLVHDWSISEKLFSLDMDNASANTVSVSRLKKLFPNLPSKGDLFHVRCCFHILNLVVHDGLKVQGFTEMLEHVKGSLKYIFVSGTRCTQFRLLCDDMGVRSKKLQLDVKHRWNSTYLMLKDAIPYRQVLSAFLDDRSCPHVIDDTDWEHAEVLCAFLKPFYDATNYFSGVHYVTSNSVLQYLYEIGNYSFQWSADFNRYFRDFCWSNAFRLFNRGLLHFIWKRFWASRNRKKRDPLATSSEELKRYYAEPEPALADIENFDVLDWWKSNEKRYPVLSCVARDVLAVQASTVASESAFSLGKRILGDYRSSLTPDMLECSVVIKDWWKADMKDIFKPIDPLNDDITPADELERLAT